MGFLFTLFQTANLYNLPSLYEETCAIACSNYVDISKQKTFLKLRYCELLSLLPRDDLVASNELFVFNSVLSWLATERWVWFVNHQNNTHIYLHKNQ